MSNTLLETSDPTVGIIFTAIHFACLALGIVLIAVKGVVHETVFLSVAVSLACTNIALLPYWSNEYTPSSPAWTVAGGWGFLVMNFVLVLYSAYALDGYIGAERDLLGRALSRTAGKVLRDAKRKLVEEDASYSAQSRARLEEVRSATFHVVHDGDPEAVTLGGPVHSSNFNRHDSFSSLSSLSDEETEPGGSARRRPKHRSRITRVPTSSFEIIARVLPRLIFLSNDPRAQIASARFDEATTELIGMGADIGQFVRQFKRRKAYQAVAFYVLSVIVLIGMAALEQATTGGKVIGWIDVGWIILGDSTLLLAAIPSMKATDSLSRPSTSSVSALSSAAVPTTLIAAPLDAPRRSRRDQGWISLIPRTSLVPPIWILLLLLLMCRGALTVVPLWLNFAAQCITYIICSTYLGYVVITERLSPRKKLPKVPLGLASVFTFWLILDTILVGLADVSDSVAVYMGEGRKFNWGAANPSLNEWILGLAAVSFVASLLLILVAMKIASKKSHKWIWIVVYILLCLTGLAIDCIARGEVSIQLGIFISVLFLFPALFLVALSFQQTFNTQPPEPRLILLVVASFILELGWALSLDRINPEAIHSFVLIPVLEFHALVCFLNVLALAYNCVLTNGIGRLVGLMSFVCYAAILPVGFAITHTTDPRHDSYLAVTVISFFVLSGIGSFAFCSMHFADVGWENVIARPSVLWKQKNPIHRWRVAFLIAVGCVISSVVCTILFFDVVSATWLGTVLVVLFYSATSLQTRLFAKPFTPREMNLRFIVLCAVAAVLFILAVVESHEHFSGDVHTEEGAFYEWTHYVIAGFVLFTFALLDFVIAIFHSLPSQILSPSENLFGLPIVRYSIERKGGEIFVYNLHVITCLACFVVLDAIGFIVAFAGASKPWGTVLSSTSFCLVALLGFHLRRVRAHGFRADLACVNLTSDLAEDAFVQVLKDTVRKIRQFSTRTIIFDSHLGWEKIMCPRELRTRLRREDKQKSLAFFFCLFNLSLKRTMRLANEEERRRARKKKLRRKKMRAAEPQLKDPTKSASVASSGPKQDSVGNNQLSVQSGPRSLQSLDAHSSSDAKSVKTGSQHLNQIPRGSKEWLGSLAVDMKPQEVREARSGEESPPTEARNSSSSSVLDEGKHRHTSRESAGSVVSVPIEEPQAPVMAELGLPVQPVFVSKTAEEEEDEASGEESSDTENELDDDDLLHSVRYEDPIEEGDEEEEEEESESDDDDIPSEDSHLFVDGSFPGRPDLVISEWDDDMAEIIGDAYEELFLWLRPQAVASTQDKPWGLRTALEDQCSFLEASIRVDPREVQQGNIGDCWLLSALSVVALKQRLFDKVLPAQRKSLEGRYMVRLFDFARGEWTAIEVDDCLPCDPESRTPIYATSKSGQVFWVSLMEKAFAKRQGGYPKLNEGQVHRALVDLTGGFSQLFSFDEDFELVESGALWTTILNLARAGHLLVLGSRTTVEEFGLVNEHAYAVMSVVEVNDSRGRHRLVQLQDPWGKTAWRGRWSDADKKRWSPRARWTADANSELVLVQGDDAEASAAQNANNKEGTFWMDFDDAAMLFKWLFACRIFAEEEGWIHHDVVAEWTEQTSGGPPHLAMTQRNPQFGLSFPSNVDASGKRRAVVFISICNIEEKETYPFMSLVLLHLQGRRVNGPILASQVVASTGKYKDARELSIEVALPLDKRFTLLPSLSSPKELGKFRLSCHAKVPFQLEKL